MKVVLIYRPQQKGGHSIEMLFHTISAELAKQAEVFEFEAGSRWEMFQDAWLLRRMSADIYHITGDVNYFALLLPKSRTVLTVHDTGHYMRTLKGIRRWLYKWLWLIWPIRAAGRVTAVSRATQLSIKEDLGITRDVVVINNCHGKIFHIVEQAFNEIAPLVLQIGTQPHKNLSRLIEALQGTTCRLSIVGKLSSEHTEQLTKAGLAYQNLTDLSDSEVFDQYVAADLVCFASLYEGFGLPIIEANAVGRPLVTSDIEPMRSIAGDAGCLVNPQDVSSIRKAITRIGEDPEYRARLVSNGFRNAERYKPAAVAARYLDVYRSLSNGSIEK